MESDRKKNIKIVFFVFMILSFGVVLLSCSDLQNELDRRSDSIMQTDQAFDNAIKTNIANGTPWGDAVRDALPEKVGMIIKHQVMFVSPSDIESFLVESPIAPDNYEVGFSPNFVPIRIAIDNDGNLLISASPELVTPIGVFDITASKEIISQNKLRLLVVQIDDTSLIYELVEDEEFYIDFSDKENYYEFVSFRKMKNGTFVLSLKSR